MKVLWLKSKAKAYVRLIKASMWLNVRLGGEQGQTLSARSHECKRLGKFNLVFVIDLLLGKGHCLHCWVNWKLRKTRGKIK